MTISELRNMTKREYALWFSKAKTSDLKEVLDTDNIVSALTKLLKPKKIRKKEYKLIA